MLRYSFLLCLAVLSLFVASAQRNLETVRDAVNGQAQTVKYNGKILIAGDHDGFMLSYDDVAFTTLTYPTVGGTTLEFHTIKNPLTIYNSAVFFSLKPTTSGSLESYLFRYNGFTFTRITIPGNIISSCIVFADNLFFISRVGTTAKLFRFNGTVSEVGGGTLPSSAGYELNSSGGFLYISGIQSTTPGSGTVNFIKRYNGSSFFTIPYTGPATNIDEIFSVPGTFRVYFTSHERIVYYDGSTVRQVYFNTGEVVRGKMWRNNLYFTTGIGPSETRTTHLFRLVGSTLTELIVPSGAKIAPVPHSNPEVYADQLYVGVQNTDGTIGVLRYNGALFFPFFTTTGPAGSGIFLFVREGNLMIHPNFVNGRNAFEFNGSSFTEIIAPPGRILFPYLRSTDCNHLWLNYYSDAGGIHWAYAKEKKDCPPPPPPPGAPVIPDHFRDYERFEFGAYGPERGWCWSEIIIDWVIVPICQIPPCPEPNYETILSDEKNSWVSKFTKPTKLSVPLPDDHGFKTVLATPDNGQKDLIVFESNLVEKGIASLTVSMKPKQNNLLLSATTRKNVTVPLKVELLNAQGAILWTQTFKAPFSQEIKALVKEPGQQLRFSIPVQ